MTVYISKQHFQRFFRNMLQHVPGAYDLEALWLSLGRDCEWLADIAGEKVLRYDRPLRASGLLRIIAALDTDGRVAGHDEVENQSATGAAEVQQGEIFAV